MRTRFPILLATVAVVAACPVATAMAHRAPTTPQKLALIRAFDRWIHVPVPVACFTYAVSSVNSAWAVQKPMTGPTSPICLKFSVGRYLLHFTGGRWKVWAGTTSSAGRGACTPYSKSGPGSGLVLPLAVAKDLELC